MSTKHPVLIIGAGIAGLALARVLQEKGISVDVYESSPRDASQGYGITLRSWAYGPLIEQLHVPFEEFCSAVATDGAVGGRGDINPTLHDALTGQPLVQAAPAKTGSPEGGLFRANRNRLRTFLLQGVNCHFEHSLVSLDADGERNLVTARFSNGAVATGCVLIGADGVFSKVRRTFLPTVEPSIGSTVVYNGERRVPRETFDSMIAPHMPHTSVFAAVADNAMISLTITEVTGTEVTMTWTYTGQPAGVETPPASESPEGLQSTIVNIFASLGKMAPPFSIALTPDQIRQDRLYHWFMRTIRLPRDGLKQMAAGGVVIVGDAAHAMPIFAGEGGNHALVDAVKLGERLSISRSSVSIEAFFDDEYPRWLEACDGSEKRTLALHRPSSVWRALAEKAKEHH